METAEPDIDEIVERYVRQEESDWHADREDVYHASKAGLCHRQEWFKMQGYEEDLPYGLFEVANRVEDIVTDALREHWDGTFVFQDLPVMHDLGDFKIVGRTDPVVMLWNLDVHILYEVKSASQRSLKYGYADVKHNYALQAALYADKLDPDRTLIVRPGRDDVTDWGSERELSDAEISKLVDEAHDWFRAFHEIDPDGEPPPADPKASVCDWCDFNEECPEYGGWFKVKAGNNKKVVRHKDEVKENDEILYEMPGDDEDEAA